MLNGLYQLTLPAFMGLLALANGAMYVSSWALVFVLQRRFQSRAMNARPVVVSRRDYLLSLLIVLINIAVGIPGWWLWHGGYIQLTEASFVASVIDFLIVFIFFDFFMYVFHRFLHLGWLYTLLHRRHHQHVDVNGISLYVMNPIEALGFGLLLIFFLLVRPFSLYALLAYLFLNWLYGTMGHVGIPFSSRILSWLVGDTTFHHKHHTRFNCNYGFYTDLWDRLLGTKA